MGLGPKFFQVVGIVIVIASFIALTQIMLIPALLGFVLGPIIIGAAEELSGEDPRLVRR